MAERAFLMDEVNPIAGEILTNAGVQVDTFPKSVSNDKLHRLAREATILGVRTSPAVDMNVLGSNKLEVVGVFSVGTDHVDLEQANLCGIAVVNSPHENTRSVAEYVLFAGGSLLRGFHRHNRAMHGDGAEHGTWTKTDEGSHEMRGKTLGIIGHGAIGSQVSVIFEVLGVRVLVHDPSPRIEHQFGNAKLVSKEELLAEADIVTIHVPRGPQVIGAQEIKQMKRGSYVINAARHSAVDYEAIIEALDSGHLAGLAADVFANEPKAFGDKFENRLRRREDVLLTPHIGGNTEEAQQAIGKNTAERILGYLTTGSSRASVTLALGGGKLTPQPLEIKPGVSRVLSVHQNIPGALDHINHPIAERGFNVVGSGLVTDSKIGYAYFDIEGDFDESVLDRARLAEETIRLKVLRG